MQARQNFIWLKHATLGYGTAAEVSDLFCGNYVPKICSKPYHFFGHMRVMCTLSLVSNLLPKIGDLDDMSCVGLARSMPEIFTSKLKLHILLSVTVRILYATQC